MIVYYKPTAITKENISKFNYGTYFGISANMLKYLNDSSLIFRLLQCASNELNAQYENLNYHIRFDYNLIPNNSIDSVNRFSLNSTSIPEEDTVHLSSMYGYSKYTRNIYKLHGVYTDKEFTRFSYPCDVILKDKLENIDISPETLLLNEGKKVAINKPINNSKVTIKLDSGFDQFALAYSDDIVYICIEGFDTSNNKISEIISIEEVIDYKSEYVYSFINNIYSIGNKYTVTINLYPYVSGDIEVWKNNIVDREYADEYKTVINIDKENKKLLFYRKMTDDISYPKGYDIEHIIDLNMPTDEIIYNHFIDYDDDLVYIITSKNKLHCYPLLIPYTFDKKIDALKTKEQSLKVKYTVDEYSEKVTFTIFPSSKTNDIELMHIYINGDLYMSDMLLDLYKEGIEDNKIEIPYEDLFVNNSALIIFETSGAKRSTLPIFIGKKNLEPLFTKDLSSIDQYGENTIDVYSTDITENTYFIDNYSFSTFPTYMDPDVEDFQITENSVLYKFSSSKDLMLDSYKIANAYNTYYYNTDNGYIITHDSISNIRLDNDAVKTSYELLDLAIAGLAIAGIAIAGKEE